MEQMLDENRAQLTGRVLDEPEFSHESYGERFYVFTLGIIRKSGFEDRIPVMISERLLCNMNFRESDMVSVSGQVRTYNRQREGRNHLMIVIFVRCIDAVQENAPMENSVIIEGFICKPTIRRTSPLGRELCDVMLAVNRLYNKSDYIPCIAWGRNAVYSGELGVGKKLYIEGRIQSRQYRKLSESGEVVEKTAYEVSVIRLEECD